MKYGGYLWGLIGLSLVIIVFLLVKVSGLGGEVQGLQIKNDRELAALQDSLNARKPISQLPNSWPRAWESI